MGGGGGGERGGFQTIGRVPKFHIKRVDYIFVASTLRLLILVYVLGYTVNIVLRYSHLRGSSDCPKLNIYLCNSKSLCLKFSFN